MFNRQNVTLQYMADELKESSNTNKWAANCLKDITEQGLPLSIMTRVASDDYGCSTNNETSCMEGSDDSLVLNLSEESADVRDENNMNSSNAQINSTDIFHPADSESESLSWDGSENEMQITDFKTELDSTFFKDQTLKLCIRKLDVTNPVYNKDWGSFLEDASHDLPQETPPNSQMALPDEYCGGMDESTHLPLMVQIKKEVQLTPEKDFDQVSPIRISCNSLYNNNNDQSENGAVGEDPSSAFNLGEQEEATLENTHNSIAPFSAKSMFTSVHEQTPKRMFEGSPTTESLINSHPFTKERKVLMSKKKKKKCPSRRCLYCKKFFTNLSMHLIRKHNHEEEVAALRKMARKDRLLKLKVLRNRGILEENKSRLLSGEKLICHRSQKDGIFKECNNCFVLYSRKTFTAHRKRCTGRPLAYQGIFPLTACDSITNDVILTFNEEIVSRLRNDALGNFVRSNEEILRLGVTNYQRILINRPTPSLKRQSASYMRYISNIYLHVCDQLKKEGISISVKEMFQLKFVRHVEMAIHKLCTSKKGGSSVHLAYAYAVKTAASDVKLENTKNKLFEYAKNNDYFIDSFNEDWNRNFRKYEDMNKMNRNKKPEKTEYVPDPKENETFKNYILSEFNDLTRSDIVWNTMNFTRLRRITFFRIAINNARKSNEILNLKVDSWINVKKENNLPISFIESLPTDKMNVPKPFKVILIEEKHTNDTVPIIIPESCFLTLDLLSCYEVRNLSNVIPSNDFLFPSTGTNVKEASKWYDMNLLHEDAGVNKSLCVDSNWRIMCVEFSHLDVDDDTREMVYKHLGSKHPGPYLIPSEAKGLNLSRSNGEMSTNEIDFEEVTNDTSTVVKMDTERNQTPDSGILDNMSDGNVTLEEDVHAFGERGIENVIIPHRERKMTPWTQEDKEHVNVFFKDYLHGNVESLNGKETLRVFFKVHPNVLENTCLSPKSKREKVRSLIHNLKKVRKSRLIKSNQFVAK